MSKYYYINESGQTFMVIGTDKKIYIDLSYEDTKMLLSNLTKTKIENVRKNGDTLRTTYEDGINVVIATAAFANRYNLYSNYLAIIRTNIKKYLEEKKLKQLKKQKGAHVKVNKAKSKKMGKLIIASGAALTFGTLAWLALNFPGDTTQDLALEDNNDLKHEDIDTLFDEQAPTEYEHFIEKAKEIPKLEAVPEDVLTQPKATEELLEQQEMTITNNSNNLDSTPIESQYTFEVEFPDKTGNGKYEETERLYGAAIKKYATRFGIPYNVGCAYISQERPDNGDPNVCQITGSIGPFSVDIYDENGPTGEKEVIEVTDAAKIDPTESIRAGLAYLRFSIDYIDSFTTGLFGYNQGPYSVDLACDYYGLDKENYKGEENSQQACELIISYFKDKNPGKVHGDPNYLSNVFGYLPLEDRSSANIECYVNGELKQIAISNQLYYNNGQTRG